MKKQVYQWSLVFVILGLIWNIIGALTLLPTKYYSQQTGFVENIWNDTETHIRKWENMTIDIVVFQIDGEKFSIMKVNNTDYSFLIGKTVQYRHSDDNLKELIYDNKIILSVDKRKPQFYRFVIYSALLIIALLFLLAIQWKKAGRDNKKVKIKDEYFFDNWSIRKHNEKYTLTYISKLDGNVKYIKITEDEFLLAKGGKIGLDNFSSKYNLW